jgi:hypothetical protein
MINFLFIKSKSKHFKHLGFLLLLFVFSTGANAQTSVSGIVSDTNGPIPQGQLDAMIMTTEEKVAYQNPGYK